MASRVDTTDFTTPARPPNPNAVGPWLIRRVLRWLERGSVTLVMPSGERFEHHCPLPGPHGEMHIHRARVFRRVLTHGDIGFAEGYIAGEWSSPDLPALITLMAANVDHLDRTFEGFWPVRLAKLLRHGRNRNTAAKSRRNIAFHYDLGNDFYRLWLDDSMTYSSALGVAPGQSLEAAQAAKRARVAELLELGAGQRVLEIGCGWGALAADLAARGGRVSALTLSAEQLDFARGALARAGLADRTELLLRDYREESRVFDRIVSIEMLEAVGERFWPVWFAQVRRCLADNGRAVVQAITIHEKRFAGYKRNPDFIQRFVFPGGMLPTVPIIEAEAARAGLRMVHAERFGAGYAQTLARWRHTFLERWDAIAALGFPMQFKRMWDYYLAYCEAGFRTGTIDVGLYVLEPAR